jgi:hypothetical protein
MAINYRKLYEEATAKLEATRAALEAARAELDRTRDIVDLAGIARHMRVERFTPQQWRQRDLLPPVDFPKLTEPLWYVSTLKAQFVNPTRRIWYDNPDAPDETDPGDEVSSVA